jgi:hypothetical protein
VTGRQTPRLLLLVLTVALVGHLWMLHGPEQQGALHPAAAPITQIASASAAMPPGMQHFAFAEGETVIQLTSIGPWEIHYINPEDDPRR